MTVIFLLHLHVLISCEDDSHYNVKIALSSCFKKTVAQKFWNPVGVSMTWTKPGIFTTGDTTNHQSLFFSTLTSTCIVNCYKQSYRSSNSFHMFTIKVGQ
jgi:hypothetical protein